MLSLQVRNFGLTDLVSTWAQVEKGHAVVLENEDIARIVIPDSSEDPCEVWLRLRKGTELRSTCSRSQCLAVLSCLRVRNWGEESELKGTIKFVSFLIARGLPQLELWGDEIQVQPLWHLPGKKGLELTDGSEILAGATYSIGSDVFLESYDNGSFWRDRESDEGLQEALRESPGIEATLLGAHITGRCSSTTVLETYRQALIIGDVWGMSNECDVRAWRAFPMSGKFLRVVGTPASPPKDYKPSFE